MHTTEVRCAIAYCVSACSLPACTHGRPCALLCVNLAPFDLTILLSRPLQRDLHVRASAVLSGCAERASLSCSRTCLARLWVSLAFACRRASEHMTPWLAGQRFWVDSKQGLAVPHRLRVFKVRHTLLLHVRFRGRCLEVAAEGVFGEERRMSCCINLATCLTTHGLAAFCILSGCPSGHAHGHTPRAQALHAPWPPVRTWHTTSEEP